MLLNNYINRLFNAMHTCHEIHVERAFLQLGYSPTWCFKNSKRIRVDEIRSFGKVHKWVYYLDDEPLFEFTMEVTHRDDGMVAIIPETKFFKEVKK